MDIGLKFSFLYLSPDLNKGITRAIFRNDGNTPLEKDKFINLERTPPMIPEISLYINTGIVCTLHFLLDTLQIFFSTSLWSVGIQTKECGKLLCISRPRNTVFP